MREYIMKYCDIESIIKFTSDLFEDALQKTMIFQIRKRKAGVAGNQKFIVSIGGGKIFSPDYIELNKYLIGKVFITGLGCSVKTGNIVWNQFMDKHKDKFLNDSKSDGKDNIPLIYPRNLKNGKIVLIKNDKKPQYIKYNTDLKPISAPVIAINRIIGSDNISLHPALIESGDYFFENHINIITGSIYNLRVVEKSLNNSKTIEFIKKIIGNTQLSKTELETMIPIDFNDYCDDDYLDEGDYLDEQEYMRD